MSFRDSLRLLRSELDGFRRSLDFEEERVANGIWLVDIASNIDSVHHAVVEELYTLKAGTVRRVQDFLHCTNSILDTWKLCHGYFSGQTGRETKCSFCDNSQCTFRADKQLRGIKSCGRLSRPLTRLDDFAVR